MLSKTPVHLYAGSNVTLGTAAGKLFRVGTLTVVVRRHECLHAVLTSCRSREIVLFSNNSLLSRRAIASSVVHLFVACS